MNDYTLYKARIHYTLDDSNKILTFYCYTVAEEIETATRLALESLFYKSVEYRVVEIHIEELSVPINIDEDLFI